MKRASANMWWIIIGAVIALVVLIVLLIIFGGKTGEFESGLSACGSKGGVCIQEGETCPGSTIKANTFDCGLGEGCCIGVAKSCKSDDDCVKPSRCEEYGSRGKFYCT